LRRLEMRVASYLFPDSLSIAMLEIDDAIEAVLNDAFDTSLKSTLFYRNFYLLSLASLVCTLSHSDERLHVAVAEDDKLLSSLQLERSLCFSPIVSNSIAFTFIISQTLAVKTIDNVVYRDSSRRGRGRSRGRRRDDDGEVFLRGS
jgi:hypothetical protein